MLILLIKITFYTGLILYNIMKMNFIYQHNLVDYQK